jgi:PiT family inorganic phosphate transporter
LVGSDNWSALPVSTTHVSVGALLGIGTVTAQARWRSVVQIGLSWIVTLPCGAILAALSFLAISCCLK